MLDYEIKLGRMFNKETCFVTIYKVSNNKIVSRKFLPTKYNENKNTIKVNRKREKRWNTLKKTTCNKPQKNENKNWATGK